MRISPAIVALRAGLFVIGTAIAALPLVLVDLPGIGDLFRSAWLFVAFAVCGLACGAMFRAWSSLFAITGYLLGTKFLESRGFIGHGGDGDLFYLFAMAGVVVFMVAAALMTVVRR